jgi:hypothetical protein
MRRGYGFTLGHHIFFGGRASHSQIIHERTHVRQFHHYGWTFGFRYAWSSAACRCYRNNIYERRAYYNQRVGRFHYAY